MPAVPGAAPNTPPPETVDVCDEQRAVYRRRYTEARRAGLTLVEAQLWADSGEDVGTLRRLVKAGATPEQIALIVL